jgi:transglutaminase-like putative cysteine protease
VTTKTSTPVRIDAELYAEATQVAPLMSRSTSQQIAHWARIGRELEASSEVSVDHVAEVLRGTRTYDSLSAKEQALVRTRWRERITALRDGLRLDREFAAAGRPYVELDDRGRVVRRDATSSPAKRRGSSG